MNHNHLRTLNLHPKLSNPNSKEKSKSLRAAMSRCLYIRGVFVRASFDEDGSEECIIQLVLSSMRHLTIMMQEPLA